MSETAEPAAPTPAPSRSGRRDAAVLAAGAALTVVLAAAAASRPLVAAALLAVVAIVALIWLVGARLARADAGALLTALLVALPLLALLGPSLALPAVPQAFLYRIVLAVVVYAGACYVLVLRRPVPFAAKDLALPLALWFAWLLLGITWASDKLSALNYAAVVTTMIAVVVATAAAGGKRRRLIWFGYSMLVAYALIVGFTVLEARLGIRMPTSRLLTTVTSQTYAVTSVFHNQNDLATYLAMCWPFMLCAFFFTRRLRWLVLDVAFVAIGAAAFVRTGSRSSLVAAGISTLAAAVLFARLRSRLSSRATKVVGFLIALALVAGAGYLLFNNSESDMLRQFRLETLIGQAKSGQGSGEIRTSLNSRGLEIAGGSFLLGAGGGQAEVIISSGTDFLTIPNLHDWWLETYADGGIVGFALHLGFFVLLVASLWPIARRDPGQLTRYLASGALLALLGFTIGALGPSSAVSFTPMWVLYGLGLAIVSRARLAAAEGGSSAAGAAPVRGDPQRQASGSPAP